MYKYGRLVDNSGAMEAIHEVGMKSFQGHELRIDSDQISKERFLSRSHISWPRPILTL